MKMAEICVFHDGQNKINEDHENRLRNVEDEITEIKIDVASSKEGIFQRLDRVCDTLNKIVSVMTWVMALFITSSIGLIGKILYDKLF